MKQLLTLILALSLFSCKDTWDGDDKNNWKQACMENARRWAGSEEKAKTYCDCVLDRMIEKYPNENDALEHINDFATDSSILKCKQNAMKN